MEDSLQDNLTTRSLLKGILATEAIHPPVRHQTKKSISRRSVSILHQDKMSVSPSISLLSQMKERVRRSFGTTALESSSLQKSLNSNKRRKSEKNTFYNVVEELDKITPRTLLKKIIQNEDEASIIVSQGSKAALGDHTKQESSCKTRLSSLNDANLSLSDLQDTDHLTVFRNARKKRRVDISQFVREVDGKMLINADNSINSNVNFEVSSTEKANRHTRSFLDHLSLSTEPQSTYKKALLRKPNKAFLVSLGDFEQGVEDKYHQVKGSQECFIESVIEDKSSASASKVAELNTELYVQPLLSNAHNSDKRFKSTSESFSSPRKKKNEDDAEWLEANTEDINTAVSNKPVGQSMEATEILMEVPEFSEPARSVRERMQIEEDAEQSIPNRNIQNSELGVKVLKDFAADKNLNASVVKDNSHSKTNQSILKYVQNVHFQSSGTYPLTRISTSKENLTPVKSISVVGSNDSLHTSETLEKYISLKKDGRISTGSLGTWKSELTEEGGSHFKSDGSKCDDLFEDQRDVPDAQPQSIVAEDNNEIKAINQMTESSELNEEPYSNNCVHISKQEEHLKSVQDDSFESTMDDDVSSHQKKVNMQPMLSAFIDTPNFIRNTRFAAPLSKPALSKKVYKVKTLKKKKEVAFKGSLVKHIFGLHSKMCVSKEALTDVETCLEEYLDQLTGDLVAYSAHANRKTITSADLELLMKRQRLVTETTSLNVLIERHLPLECRKLLIPCAMSGNRVFPCLPKM